jgi:hypothetical protein
VLFLKDDRRAELGGKADKGRNVVSDFTSAIEQMRLVRDQKMADINRLQLRIEVNAQFWSIVTRLSFEYDSICSYID